MGTTQYIQSYNLTIQAIQYLQLPVSEILKRKNITIDLRYNNE